MCISTNNYYALPNTCIWAKFAKYVIYISKVIFWLIFF